MDQYAVLIPVFNEQNHIASVLYELRSSYTGDVIFVDDGSRDGSPSVLMELESDSVVVLRHAGNQGYGASLMTGFNYAIKKQYTSVVTMDCDWQHEPHLVPSLFSALESVDVVSGSRYLKPSNQAAPKNRKAINFQITKELDELTGLKLTDSFCGFKAYRVEALRKLQLDETGYAFPLQFWIQAAHFKLRIKEVSVPLIYLDFSRSFGGSLDQSEVRLKYYREVMQRELKRWKA
jgi:glycosyltransferase involved in cell wall biosynthesis